MDTNLTKLLDTVKDKEVWHAVVHGIAKSRTRLSNWTTVTTGTDKHLGTYLQTKRKQKRHLKFWDSTVLQKYSNLMLFLNSIKNWSELYQDMEKAMAPDSSTLAWKIPWMEEPGGLKSMGSLGVGHDWATSLWLFTFMHWRRKWQPTPVLLPGESHGQRSLVGCSPWGR